METIRPLLLHQLKPGEEELFSQEPPRGITAGLKVASDSEQGKT
jgi:hypothetical protein